MMRSCWRPFLPIVHHRIEWPELWQGMIVSGATGLALVPLLSSEMGLTFEQAIAFLSLQSLLIFSSSFLFHIPLAPGWITPVLPMVLIHLSNYRDPTEKIQAMTSIVVMFGLLCSLLGYWGVGRKLVQFLPAPIRTGIVLGAALAAARSIFFKDYDRLVGQQFLPALIAVVVTYLVLFTKPVQGMESKYPFLSRLRAYGLLPGLILAGLGGGMEGTLHWAPDWRFSFPPYLSMWNRICPLAIGFPSAKTFLEGLPLVLVGYLFLFTDYTMGSEIINKAQPERTDDPIDLNPDKLHQSVGIRNLLSGLLCPFFPAQGCLWSGVHVLLVERWKQGPGAIQTLQGAINSYYLLGCTILFFLTPLLVLLKPLMNLTLLLTLALTGYVCGNLAIQQSRGSRYKGVIALTGVILAVHSVWLGLLAGIFSMKYLYPPDK